MTGPEGPTARCGECRAEVEAGDRFCRACGAAVTVLELPMEARKNVVVLFIDLVGSTSLAERHDPEVIRRVLDLYYRVCAQCVERHGGAMEKYIGDAIMAVFGIEASREDDAHRAVRAGYAAVELVHGIAGELRLPGVELDAHCGISSGEAVVINVPGIDFRVIGDTVNTASRLQSAAGPGQVLVNAEAAHLVRRDADLVEVAPLPLRGKASPVRAWLVLSPQATTVPTDRTVLIDRQEELATLVASHRRCVIESTCYRVFVTGDPGVGKSRLVRDFVGGAATRSAVALTGRCESYGQDITYQPVVSMLEALADQNSGIGDLLGDDDADRRVVGCLTTLVDSGSDQSPVGAAEIRWAVARLIAAVARRQPVITVWEDLQWAKPDLMDLMDELSVWLRDVPVLMVCVARTLPSTDYAGECRVAIELAPLAESDTTLLAAALVEATTEVTGQAEVALIEATTRIARVCQGNPLFATVLAESMADGQPAGSVPPTVAAILQTRFDALPPMERLTLQWAAVVGVEFGTDPLHVLAATQGRMSTDVVTALYDLERRGIVQRSGGGRYRFAQTLMYETCGAMTAKTLRADWHATLTRIGLDRGDKREILMYHAEASCLLLQEVRPDDDRLPELLDTAVPLLAEQGTIALHRKDMTAAIALLSRALALASPDRTGRAALVVRLCDALLTAGDSTRATRLILESEQDCVSDGDRLILRIQHGIVALRLGRTNFGTARDDVGAITTDLATRPQDDLSWCLRHQFAGLLEHACGRTEAAEAEFRAALDRAYRLGDRYSQDRLLGACCELGQWSPTPVLDALGLCDELVARFDADRLLLVPVLTTRARLLAMTGHVVDARAALQTARRHAADLRADLALAAVTQMDATVEAMAGDHEAANARFTEAAVELRSLGHVVPARTLEIYAVRELLRAGRRDPAAVAQLGGDNQQLDQRALVWLALVRARSAGGDTAVAMSRCALDTIRSDDPCLLGDVWFEHAVIAYEACHYQDVVPAVDRSLRHFMAKGATLPARTVRAWAVSAGVGGTSEGRG